MNNTILKTKGLLIILALSIFYSCEDDMFKDKAILFDVKAKVDYPENYSKTAAEGVKVRLINLENGLELALMSDANGEVTFPNVKKGNYRISFSKKMSAADAANLGDTIVTNDDIASGRLLNLNASKESLSLLDATDLESVKLQPSLPGDLLIKEVFYTGTRTPNGKAYYSDHFVEIFNNTSKPIMADSIYIATLYGSNGSVDNGPSTLCSDKENVYLEFVWMIPPVKKVIKPGQSIVIAEDGINHRTEDNNPNSIDLSHADFETFLKRDIQKDVDVAEVPNMTEIFASRQGTHDFIFHSYGPAVILFKIKDISTLEKVPYPYDATGQTLLKLPIKNVLDAFEALAHSTSGEYKRIPKSLDAGFIFCHGIFNGESCRRVTEDFADGRRILQDTNNSSDDFEVIPFPTPKSFE